MTKPYLEREKVICKIDLNIGTYNFKINDRLFVTDITPVLPIVDEPVYEKIRVVPYWFYNALLDFIPDDTDLLNALYDISVEIDFDLVRKLTDGEQAQDKLAEYALILKDYIRRKEQLESETRALHHEHYRRESNMRIIKNYKKEIRALRKNINRLKLELNM